MTASLLPTYKELPVTIGSVSNSELNSFRTCKQQHLYAHGQKIAPRRRSDALEKGIIGHEVLEIFFKSLQAGQGYLAAAAEANAHIDALITAVVTNGSDADDLNLLADLRKRLVEYMTEEVVLQDFMAQWEIVLVEEVLSMGLPNGITYSMRLDLLLRGKIGPYKGKYVLMDHKFLGDFYTDRKVKANPQVPRYLAILRHNGYPVKTAIYNMIRTRVNKSPMSRDAKFKYAEYTPESAVIKQILHDDARDAGDIEFYRTLGLERWEQEISRNMGSMTCGYCGFFNLCQAELAGQDTTVMRQTDFIPNEYGYDEDA